VVSTQSEVLLVGGRKNSDFRAESQLTKRLTGELKMTTYLKGWKFGEQENQSI